jgi:hypothetical protein
MDGLEKLSDLRLCTAAEPSPPARMLACLFVPRDVPASLTYDLEENTL